MFCTVCATPNPIAAEVCLGCGYGLRGGTAQATRVRSTAPHRRLAWFGLCGLPLLIALVLMAGVYRVRWIEPAAWYARGEDAAAAGRHAEAIMAFDAAIGYRDADARRDVLAVAFAPFRAAYLAAATANDAGRHQEALDILGPVVRTLPAYAEAALLLADVRRLHTEALLRSADGAEARRDWLLAERALAELAATIPGDAVIATRLATVRQYHAPIVFAQDHALRWVGPDGADERVLVESVPVAWPTWSPDRSRIAFTSAEPGAGIALYVVDPDGAGLRRLTGGLRPYSGPVWSPDGTRLAFAVEGGGRDRPGQTEPDPPGIQVVDVATGRITDVTRGRIANPVYPSWAPDGRRLAFVSRGPDSLASFDSPPPGEADRATSGEVIVASLITGDLVNVTNGQIAYPWRVAASPVDERLLVYTRDPGMSYDRDRAQVVLLDPLTGENVPVSTGGERITMPVWAPDGQRIAYVAGEGTVVVVRADDGTERRIELPSPISRFLSWSPDGAALLAVAEDPTRPSFLVPLTDPAAEPVPILIDHDTDRRQAGSPQWGPALAGAIGSPSTIAGTGLDPQVVGLMAGTG